MSDTAFHRYWHKFTESKLPRVNNEVVHEQPEHKKPLATCAMKYHAVLLILYESDTVDLIPHSAMQWYL